jgi:catechol 2,3-dioxygenase-like lactoylglutathione lyase family enzyme
MLDHVSIAVRNLTASADAYEQILAPLGLTRLVERAQMIGFGKAYPEFWLNLRPALARGPENPGSHVCIRARDEAAVRAFHETALREGWTSAGEPGIRQAAMARYFGAFICDIDGNKIEAATFLKDE